MLIFDVVDQRGVEWDALGILALVADLVCDLGWIVDAEAAPGPRSAALVRRLGERLSFTQLLFVLAPRPQLIEGEIRGFGPRGAVALTLAAVDGTHWDLSASKEVLRRVHQSVAGAQQLAE